MLRYVVEKGSIAVDGVSLTVAEVAGDAFGSRSSRRRWSGQARPAAPGRLVNLEVDVSRSTSRSWWHDETRRGSRRSRPIEEAIEDIRAGRMVVVCDDEDRENEGDLTIAAEFVDARGHQLHGPRGPRAHLPGADARSAATSSAST